MDGLHSEERLIKYVEIMQTRGNAVEIQRIFSDRIPCGVERANCRGKLSEAFGSGLEVYYNILGGKVQ